MNILTNIFFIMIMIRQIYYYTKKHKNVYDKDKVLIGICTGYKLRPTATEDGWCEIFTVNKEKKFIQGKSIVTELGIQLIE